MKALLVLPFCAALIAQTALRERPHTGRIATGDTIAFTVSIQSGQVALFQLVQPRFATRFRLLGPDGRTCVELNLTGSTRRPEMVAWVADHGGNFRLELQAAAGPPDRDQYRITLEKPRAALASDRKMVDAQAAYAAGREFEAKHDSVHAIEAWEKSIALYRDAGDRAREAVVLLTIGVAHSAAGRSDRALPFYAQALSIFRDLHDRRGEGESLYGLGDSFYRTGQAEKAAGYHHQAIPIFHTLKDPSHEAQCWIGLGAVTLGGAIGTSLRYYERGRQLARRARDRKTEARALVNIGTVYDREGLYQAALENYERGRILSIEQKDRFMEAAALADIGIIFHWLGRGQESAEKLDQALQIFREVGNRRLEGHVLYALGETYSNMNLFENAIRADEQALVIEHEVRDLQSEGLTLANLGNFYSQLGQYDQAIEFYERALPMNREVGDRYNESVNLSLLADEYLRRKEYGKAAEYCRRSLGLSREVKHRLQEGKALSSLGVAICGEGNCGRAIEYQQQALAIAREIGNRSGEAWARANMGEEYRKIGEVDKAIVAYQQALAIFRETQEPAEESWVLEDLMEIAKDLGRPALAVFYGKQSVNAVQSIRGKLDGLDKQLQSSFLRAREKRYHTLAELLISQGRLAEAEQVLALLKEEEYFQFVRRDAGEGTTLAGRADLTPQEAEWDKRWREIGGHLMAIGAERGELLAKRVRTAQETRRLTQLEQDLTAGNFAFEGFLRDLSRNFTAAPERLEQIRETQGIVEDLRELPAGTVAIYTLVGSDKFRAILRSADAVKAYEYPIKGADLNKKVLEFRQAAQNPEIDPRPLAQELYKIIVAGMADDLCQAKAQTLMWSLDGVLRYLPVAALYDGRQFLIEQYRVS